MKGIWTGPAIRRIILNAITCIRYRQNGSDRSDNGKDYPQTAISAFINILAHPATAMISPAARKNMARRLVFIRWEPGRMNWYLESDRFCEGEKIRGLLAARLPKLDSITWRPVADNNTRAECCKPVKRSLLSPFPTSRPHAGEKQKYRVDGQSVNYAALYSMNVTQKPFDNPKVREALNSPLTARRW